MYALVVIRSKASLPRCDLAELDACPKCYSSAVCTVNDTGGGKLLTTVHRLRLGVPCRLSKARARQNAEAGAQAIGHREIDVSLTSISVISEAGTGGLPL